MCETNFATHRPNNSNFLSNIIRMSVVKLKGCADCTVLSVPMLLSI